MHAGQCGVAGFAGECEPCQGTFANTYSTSAAPARRYIDTDLYGEQYVLMDFSVVPHVVGIERASTPLGLQGENLQLAGRALASKIQQHLCQMIMSCAATCAPGQVYAFLATRSAFTPQAHLTLCTACSVLWGLLHM